MTIKIINASSIKPKARTKQYRFKETISYRGWKITDRPAEGDQYNFWIAEKNKLAITDTISIYNMLARIDYIEEM